MARVLHERLGVKKVTYACDYFPLVQPLIQCICDTQSCGLGCLFLIIVTKAPTLEWEVRYRSKARVNTHNHPPSQDQVREISPYSAFYPNLWKKYRRLLILHFLKLVSNISQRLTFLLPGSCKGQGGLITVSSIIILLQLIQCCSSILFLLPPRCYPYRLPDSASA